MRGNSCPASSWRCRWDNAADCRCSQNWRYYWNILAAKDHITHKVAKNIEENNHPTPACYIHIDDIEQISINLNPTCGQRSPSIIVVDHIFTTNTINIHIIGNAGVVLVSHGGIGSIYCLGVIDRALTRPGIDSLGGSFPSTTDFEGCKRTIVNRNVTSAKTNNLTHPGAKDVHHQKNPVVTGDVKVQKID